MVMCVVVFHFPTGVLSGSSFLLRVQPMNGPLTYLTDRIVRPLVVRPLCLSLDGDDLAHTNEMVFPDGVCASFGRPLCYEPKFYLFS